MKTITLTEDEYEEFFNDHLLMNALRRAGVDNWDGWEFALDYYHEMLEEAE